MSRMTGRNSPVIGGVDTHADTHEAAVLDARGRLLAVKRFASTDEGHRQLLAWMRSFGRIRQIGVEGTGSYGAELTRHLRAAGVKVVEVNQPHAHTRSRRGKSDAIDAEAAARKVLAGDCTAIPKDTTGIVEAIRQLHVARAGAVQARTAALNQLDDLLVTAPAELRQELTAKTLKGKAGQCADWQLDGDRLAEPVQAARSALRSIAKRISSLNDEIRVLERQLSTLVKVAAPRTLKTAVSVLRGNTHPPCAARFSNCRKPIPDQFFNRRNASTNSAAVPAAPGSGRPSTSSDPATTPLRLVNSTGHSIATIDTLSCIVDSQVPVYNQRGSRVDVDLEPVGKGVTSGQGLMGVAVPNVLCTLWDRAGDGHAPTVWS